MASVYFLNVSVEHSKAFLLALEIALGFFTTPMIRPMERGSTMTATRVIRI